MDKVIDKLLLEWSWRCEKGYPDINNPADKKVLDKLLAEYGISINQFLIEQEKEEEKEIDVDKLIDLIKSKKDTLDTQFLTTVYKTVQDKGKGLSAKIIKILKDKNIDKAAGIILTAAQRLGIEEKLADYLSKQEAEKPGISDLKNNAGSDLIEFFSNKTNLPSEFLKVVSGGDTPIGSKGVGKAEYILALLGRNGSKQSIGDVEIEGKSIEVKADLARLGERAGNLQNLYTQIQDTFNIAPRPVRGGSENFVSYIENVTSTLTTPEDLNKLKKIINTEFENKFTNIDIKNTSEVKEGLFSWYVDNFYDTEPSDLILLYLNGKFKLYTKEEFKQDVLQEKIKFNNQFGATNKAPQLSSFE